MIGHPNQILLFQLQDSSQLCHSSRTFLGDGSFVLCTTHLFLLGFHGTGLNEFPLYSSLCQNQGRYGHQKGHIFHLVHKVMSLALENVTAKACYGNT